MAEWQGNRPVREPRTRGGTGRDRTRAVSAPPAPRAFDPRILHRRPDH
ncbi:hypothetical protein SLNHY_3729 [Streptomyces albus]|nr:hypothetical protein SLNHY_3729 [Streptomyces albus]